MSRRSRGKARVLRVIELDGFAKRVVYDTRLDRFLDARNIPPSHLAVAADRSRQHVLRLRSNDLEPTLGVIRDLTAGCIAIAGDPAITPEDLFELAPSTDEIAEARNRDVLSEGPERRRDIARTGRTYRPRHRRS